MFISYLVKQLKKELKNNYSNWFFNGYTLSNGRVKLWMGNGFFHLSLYQEEVRYKLRKFSLIEKFYLWKTCCKLRDDLILGDVNNA